MVVVAGVAVVCSMLPHPGNSRRDGVADVDVRAGDDTIDAGRSRYARCDLQQPDRAQLRQLDGRVPAAARRRGGVVGVDRDHRVDRAVRRLGHCTAGDDDLVAGATVPASPGAALSLRMTGNWLGQVSTSAATGVVVPPGGTGAVFVTTGAMLPLAAAEHEWVVNNNISSTTYPPTSLREIHLLAKGEGVW